MTAKVKKFKPNGGILNQYAYTRSMQLAMNCVHTPTCALAHTSTTHVDLICPSVAGYRDNCMHGGMSSDVVSQTYYTVIPHTHIITTDEFRQCNCLSH